MKVPAATSRNMYSAMSDALMGELSSSLPTCCFMAGVGPRKESSRLVWKKDGHTT
ncbi:hypothetical protein D3C72_2528920 [compost metagenome]